MSEYNAGRLTGSGGRPDGQKVLGNEAGAVKRDAFAASVQRARQVRDRMQTGRRASVPASLVACRVDTDRFVPGCP